ncbi:hypothetical protein ABT354_19500 [Streptomyces sp. NPDC000594]|uniref:hypothetical protein n=1 Tax=Streptomyces sp. NPDC000594 TaxID=3154261 RepID=UPI00332962EF
MGPSGSPVRRAAGAPALTALADRAEATALVVGIAPFLSRELTHLAGALGPLNSRVTLPGGRALYVAEGYDPVYRAPGSTTRAAMNGLLDATVRGLETVVAVVRHRHDVLLVPGPQGLRPPLTVRGERESVAQAAARAVWEQTGYAAVVTHHLDTPAGTPRHVLCAVPGALEQHGPDAEWAPADAVPGLPPFPHPVSGAPDGSGDHGA